MNKNCCWASKFLKTEGRFLNKTIRIIEKEILKILWASTSTIITIYQICRHARPTLLGIVFVIHSKNIVFLRFKWVLCWHNHTPTIHDCYWKCALHTLTFFFRLSFRQCRKKMKNITMVNKQWKREILFTLTLWVPVGYICPTLRYFLIFKFSRIGEKYFQ
jgi:hypothetical protein